MKKNVIKINESALRKIVSETIKESLQNAKPWSNDTGHAVGNFDTSEVKRWNNLYNKPYDNFGRDTEEFTTDLDDRKKYWEATVKDFKNALKSDPALKKDIADMIKSGEYDSFNDENLILDWADQHLWNRPNPNSEYWKFRKSIESQGMEDAKEFHDSAKDGYSKKYSTDELWYAHDTDDEKDFDRLSRPIKESQLRKMVSKAIRESLRTLNEGTNYMSVLQKYGFQPIESDGDADWVPNEALNNNEAYFISVLTPQGWYHSDVYNYSEEEMFNIAEEITDALQSMGWIEDLSQRGMCGKEEYSDVAYIEAVFDGQYDDVSEGGIGTDTCGSFVVGQDGQCFWMD